MPDPDPERKHTPLAGAAPGAVVGHGAVVAVILAGGASTRFGARKADARFDGVASHERIRRACAACVEVVVTVGGPGADVPDLVPGAGPLQALVAAFQAYPGRDLFVVACDVPLITPAWIAAITAPLPAETDLRVPRVAGRPQPLAALWGAGCAGPVRAAWARGERAVMPLVHALRVAWLELGEPDPALEDFDTPEDAARLARALSGPAGTPGRACRPR